jgi:ribosomal protein S18 acetylase RimI-like enzyme
MPAEQPVQVRPYDAADRDQVLALAPRLTEGTAPWRDPAAKMAAAKNWVRSSADTAAEPGRAFFVATIGQQVVGLVTLGERRHYTGQVDAYVGELVTAAGMERRGIARQLMTAAEQWAADRELAFLTLETGAANQGARAFYAAIGYAEEDVRLTKQLRPGR